MDENSMNNLDEETVMFLGDLLTLHKMLGADTFAIDKSYELSKIARNKWGYQPTIRLSLWKGPPRWVDRNEGFCGRCLDTSALERSAASVYHRAVKTTEGISEGDPVRIGKFQMCRVSLPPSKCCEKCTMMVDANNPIEITVSVDR
jgi:hypothetical protein